MLPLMLVEQVADKSDRHELGVLSLSCVFVSKSLASWRSCS